MCENCNSEQVKEWYAVDDMSYHVSIMECLNPECGFLWKGEIK